MQMCCSISNGLLLVLAPSMHVCVCVCVCGGRCWTHNAHASGCFYSMAECRKLSMKEEKYMALSLQSYFLFIFFFVSPAGSLCLDVHFLFSLHTWIHAS